MSRFIPMRVASPREAQRLRAPSLNAPDGSASTLYRTWSNLGVFESYRSLDSPPHKTVVSEGETSDEDGPAAAQAVVRGALSAVWTYAQVPTLLALTGALTALFAAAVDTASQIIAEWRVSHVLDDPHPRHYGYGNDDQYSPEWHSANEIGMLRSAGAWLRYAAYSLTLALGSLVWTTLLEPEAGGSGVPEVKTVLSGVVRPALLSGRAIGAKLGGVTLAIGAGLSVGKEGPFVHVAAATADVLMRALPPFRTVITHSARRLEVLGCACAAGVAATFGTPLGAVLFAAEVTGGAGGGFDALGSLPRAYFCATTAMLALTLLGRELQINLFTFDNPQDARDPAAAAGLWPDDDDDDGDGGGGGGGGDDDDDARGDGASLLSSDVYKGTLASLSVFLVLGTLCGVLGALFVRAVSAYVALRNRVLARASERGGGERGISAFLPGGASSAAGAARGAVARRAARKAAFVAATTLLVAPLAYWDLASGLYGPTWRMAAYFFRPGVTYGLSPSLLLYPCYKLVATTLCVSLPIPVGLFSPVFVAGAALGRLCVVAPRSPPRSLVASS